MSTKYLQSGFSLVETLVAITILLIVIVGPMTIISSSAKSTSFASEQVVAFFLAQEGAELAQKARDDILLDGFLLPSDGNYNPAVWTTFTDQAGFYSRCFDANGCGLEVANDSIGSLLSPVDCGSSGSGCSLYYDNNSSNIRSRYTHSSLGNAATIYQRNITFTNPVASPYGVRVVSKVSWFTGSLAQQQTVEVETYLFDVYGN